MDDYDSVEEARGQAPDHLATHEVSTKIASLLCCLAMSIVELGTAGDLMHKYEKTHQKVVLAIVLGVISTVACLVRLALFRVDKLQFNKYDSYLSTGLVILWAILAGLETSKGGPFATTNNGYFSTWCAFGTALHFLYVSSQAMTQHKLNDELSRQNSNLCLVFVASLVELAVAADFCDTQASDCSDAHPEYCQKPCTPHEAFGIVVGVLSVVSVGIHLVLTRVQHPLRDTYELGLAPGLALLWTIGAGMNTGAHGPFSSSCDYANGYFSTWIAFAGSVRYAWSVLLLFISTGDDNGGHNDYSETLIPPAQGSKQEQEAYTPLPGRGN